MLATMGYITPEQLVREYELMCFLCMGAACYDSDQMWCLAR